MDNPNNMYNNMPTTNWRPETPQEKKAGNLWSLASLLCFLFGVFATGIITVITAVTSAVLEIITGTDVLSINEKNFDIVFGLGVFATIILLVAALVIIIFVRVNYPKNIFGKVLMWVYIVLFAMFIITIAVVIISCGLACGACVESLESCGQMGSVIVEGYRLC